MSTLHTDTRSTDTNVRGSTLLRGSAGAWLVAFVSILLIALFTPALIQGGLLADEYVMCVSAAHDGYGRFLQDSWREYGIVRLARFIELALIWSSCSGVPSVVAMLVTLALKFAAAYLLVGLLRDLEVPSPWPEIGAAIWLLEPLGTEAALWAAALHFPLGLCLALGALRLYRRGRVALGALASVIAACSVEQVIFALPLAVWLTVPQPHRRRATLSVTAVMIGMIALFATWPGENERTTMSLAERWQNALAKREWYVLFPAAGLGLYSGALAFGWAFPFSLAIVLAGAITGGLLLPRLLRSQSARPLARHAASRGILAVGLLIALVNLPLIVTDVGYSARTFSPTWLVLSAASAYLGARVRWRRARLLGVVSGVAASFAVLSLALSVSVRVRTDEFNRAAARWIADRTRDGAVVAVCDVERTAVTPAPLGSFHLHAFHSESGDWIEHLSGRRVTVRRSGERYWGARCPDLSDADLVIRFPELVAELVSPVEDGSRR